MFRGVEAVALLLICSCPLLAQENFLFSSSGEMAKVTPLLERLDISGVQIVYNWKDLEHGEGQYDFSLIEQDLGKITALHKKLFVQLQDRCWRI